MNTEQLGDLPPEQSLSAKDPDLAYILFCKKRTTDSLSPNPVPPLITLRHIPLMRSEMEMVWIEAGSTDTSLIVKYVIQTRITPEGNPCCPMSRSINGLHADTTIAISIFRSREQPATTDNLAPGDQSLSEGTQGALLCQWETSGYTVSRFQKRPHRIVDFPRTSLKIHRPRSSFVRTVRYQ